MVGAGYADLQTLRYFVSQFVEHADGPVGHGQTQPAHFRQFNVHVVVLAAVGHVDIDRRRRYSQQRRVVVVALTVAGTRNVISSGRRRRWSCSTLRISRELCVCSSPSPIPRCLQDVRPPSVTDGRADNTV